MNPLDRKEAEARLAEMEKQIEELRTIINAPVEKAALINLSNKYYVLYGEAGTGKFCSSMFLIEDDFLENDATSALFESEEQAGAYGKAFATMAELRRQPGTITPSERRSGTETNWTICPVLNSSDQVTSVGVDYRVSKQSAMSCISPTFKTRDHVVAAIARIGQENLAHMFKTFHHSK